MKPRKKILIIVAGVITALLLIVNSFIGLNTTAGLSQGEQDKEAHFRPSFLIFY